MMWHFFFLSSELSVAAIKRLLLAMIMVTSATLLTETPTQASGKDDVSQGDLVTATTPLLAQNPNSNTEPLPEITPLPEENPPSIQPPAAIPSTSPDSGDRPSTLSNIQIIGSTVFSDTDFAPILTNSDGKTLSQIADAITQLYLEKGYITSRARVAASAPDTIEIIEGRVDQINLQGNNKLSENYLTSRLRLGTKAPLNTAQLEDQLRLLKLNPLLENIEATLKAGEGLGVSDLDVTVTEARSFVGNVGVDNFSPASVGSERMTLDLAEQNLTGAGDRLSFGYIRTTRGGADSLDLAYTRPINAKDGSITLRSVFSSNKVIQEPFNVLDIRGESERYEISYRQPIIRTPREEFALGFGFSYQDGLTFLGDELFGFNIGTENGKSTTSILKFTQEYIKRQPLGALSLRSQFSFGTELFDATDNIDPIPDGQFWSWLGQVQGVRLLNPDNLLIVQADLQLTPDPLLPSQQFVMGGGQSLRGFRQNARSADNGFRFSVENRFTVARNAAGDSVFQLAPFFDLGTVWNNSDNPNVLPDQKFLAGLGIGAWWQLEKGFTVRLDYALPLVDLSDRGKNIQDDGLYFNVNYAF
jgi:hemolysin activation/secretion protein